MRFENSYDELLPSMQNQYLEVILTVNDLVGAGLQRTFEQVFECSNRCVGALQKRNDRTGIRYV